MKKLFLLILILPTIICCGENKKDQNVAKSNNTYCYSNEKAATFIKNNKANKSKSMCAWYVIKAIRHGGCDNIPLCPAYAYNKVLPQLGFKELSTTHYTPKKGDVSVLPQNSHSPFGHIAIYDGTHWISDFEQKSIFPGQTYRSVGKYQIFRLEDGWHQSNLKFDASDVSEHIKVFVSGFNRIKWTS